MSHRPAATVKAEFETSDDTNLTPDGEHMSKLVITVTDAGRHDEAWTSRTNGTDGAPETFSYTRKE